MAAVLQYHLPFGVANVECLVDKFCEAKFMAYPQVRVAPSAAKRIRHHDCWVFRDELLPPAPAAGNGELVELIDPHGTVLGAAFYSVHSHIAARVVTTRSDQPIDRGFFAERLQASLTRRRLLTGTNARRLVFSEADGLPGLIVDQYADVLVLQCRTAGMERWKSLIVDLLTEAVHPKGILERSDKAFRDEEGLPPLVQVLSGTVPERILIEEDGLRFWVDPYRGHKTGFYLDQRQTRRLVRARIQPGQRVADVCAYTGAFGIGAASRGAHVLCIEREEPWIALAKENAALNGLASRMEFIAGDAWYWLEAAASGRRRMDWVLLDPPSLAKGKAEVPKGRQVLHHLLRHAFGALAPGGMLAVSVCTYHLLGVADEIIRIAAADHAIRLRVLGLSLQADDHPWILQMPMTRYLMSWLVQCDGRPAA